MDGTLLKFGIVFFAILPRTLCGIRPYIFDDMYYNQFIMDQINDYFMPWRESYNMDRIKTLRPKLRFRNEICCGPYGDEIMLREDRIREECFDEVFNGSRRVDFEDGWNHFNPSALPVVAAKLICLQECMWKRRRTFQGKYAPLTGILLDALNPRMEREWKQLSFPEKAVAGCLPKNNPDQVRLFRSLDECKREYFDFSYCVWEEMHADCPDKMWDFGNPWCNKIKDYLTRRRRLAGGGAE